MGYKLWCKEDCFWEQQLEPQGWAPSPSALTQKPDIFIPEILEPGHPVTAVCLFSWTSEQCPAPAFFWTGAAVSSQEPRPHTSSYYSVLSFTAGLEHHDTELTCWMDFSGKMVQRTVRLSVACECDVAFGARSSSGGGRWRIPQLHAQEHSWRHAGDVTWLVECLPGMHKPLASIPITT